MAETFVTKFSEQIALNIELTEESVGIFVTISYTAAGIRFFVLVFYNVTSLSLKK